jgi:flagellar biosynthetic protein FlhB
MGVCGLNYYAFLKRLGKERKRKIVSDWNWDLQFFADEEKTEEATPRKLQEARKKGQIPRSSELSAVVTLLAGFTALNAFSQIILNRLYGYFQFSFSSEMLNTNLDEIALANIMNGTILTVIGVFLPTGLTILAAGIIINYLQSGGIFTLEPLKMKLDRINPLQGFKRMFSPKKLVDLFKALFKLGGVIIIIWSSFKGPVFSLAETYLLNPTFQVAATIWRLMYKIVLRVSLLLMVLAVFDYFYQRYEYRKNLRMTKKEVQDEFKQTEGDPKIKSRIRQKQRQIAMRRMMQEIPKADVVITNPTHLAVALKYEAAKMEAPQVLAKGEGYIAAKIKELAAAHNVPMVENKPLARTIYQTVEIGGFVPPHLYQAVAEVLAFVYKLRQK